MNIYLFYKTDESFPMEKDPGYAIADKQSQYPSQIVRKIW